MSELHGNGGGKVLDFDLLKPHEEARLRCKNCGNVARHVWPQRTPMHTLECGGCGATGYLAYDLPEGQTCGHDQSVYQWFRTVGDSETIDSSQPFCVRCELARLEQENADLRKRIDEATDPEATRD